MNLRIIQIGKSGSSFLADGEAEYKKRLGRYLKLEVIELPDIKGAKRSESEIRTKEGEQILSRIEEKDHVVLLDEHGKTYRSIEFASWFDKKGISGVSSITFVIGGPYGFSESMRARANEMLSLSAMTFSHQMVRMIFLEQVYRAMTIMRNEPYHHE